MNVFGHVGHAPFMSELTDPFVVKWLLVLLSDWLRKLTNKYEKKIC